MAKFELTKALISGAVCVEFDKEVYFASDLANKTKTLSARDIIVMAKSDESPIRLLSTNEAAGKLTRKWNKRTFD